MKKNIRLLPRNGTKRNFSYKNLSFIIIKSQVKSFSNRRYNMTSEKRSTNSAAFNHNTPFKNPTKNLIFSKPVNVKALKKPCPLPLIKQRSSEQQVNEAILKPVRLSIHSTHASRQNLTTLTSPKPKIIAKRFIHKTAQKLIPLREKRSCSYFTDTLDSIRW